MGKNSGPVPVAARLGRTENRRVADRSPSLYCRAVSGRQECTTLLKSGGTVSVLRFDSTQTPRGRAAVCSDEPNLAGGLDESRRLLQSSIHSLEDGNSSASWSFQHGRPAVAFEFALPQAGTCSDAVIFQAGPLRLVGTRVGPGHHIWTSLCSFREGGSDTQPTVSLS
ncbi:hypothetical protein VTK56DRAFT_3416 [Thermocarpiscus australiensis]